MGERSFVDHHGSGVTEASMLTTRFPKDLSRPALIDITILTMSLYRISLVSAAVVNLPRLAIAVLYAIRYRLQVSAST